MYLFAFVTLLAISAAPPAPAPSGRGISSPKHATLVAARVEHAAQSDAFALRARRRFAAYLRLRLLEMREAGLERAAAVVERRLPIDTLMGKRRSP